MSPWPSPANLVPPVPVLESDAEPGGMKFVQLGAWENAYFATRSKSRQKRVNCIILANLCNLWCLFTLWSWNYQHQGTVLCSQKSKTHSSKKRKADNIHAQQGTSQIKSEVRLLPRSSWIGWLRKHAFAGFERVSSRGHTLLWVYRQLIAMPYCSPSLDISQHIGDNRLTQILV